VQTEQRLKDKGELERERGKAAKEAAEEKARMIKQQADAKQTATQQEFDLREKLMVATANAQKEAALAQQKVTHTTSVQDIFQQQVTSAVTN